MAHSYFLRVEFDGWYQTIDVVRALLKQSWKVYKVEDEILQIPLDVGVEAETLKSLLVKDDHSAKFNARTDGSKFLSSFYIDNSVVSVLLSGRFERAPRVLSSPDLNFWVETIVGPLVSGNLRIAKFTIEYR
ncbi:hypothetical protein [Deinococcus aetherius]|uniref:hypothetical protein n=1 Tax=Deinococcus aetherius TaxID=200252 RepID=UPI0022319E1A|nr:hypothetical protein [Deinococcus aetherius]